MAAGLLGSLIPSLLPLNWVLKRWKFNTNVCPSHSFQCNYQGKTWRLKLKFVPEIAR